MSNGCVFCGRAHFNFGDADDDVEMRIDDTGDGRCVIAIDQSYAWSIPINYCPYCGRNLMKQVNVD